MTAALKPEQTEAPPRAALYFRVSTGRQAESDLSIPDQRRQALAYCAARGWDVAIEFVEPGMSGTDDRRPELQRLLDMATAGGAPFDVVLVHSFSRFARDHFALEMHVRRLRKAGVRLVSITQDLGEDPMSMMVRQVFALFDEYQSKENAKHTLRAMQENARQGFWNGSKAPNGYAVVAAEQRGAKTKKRLAIDPVEAEVIRLIFRLFREGDGASGPMGVKSVTSWLNEHGHRTRLGARWGIGPTARYSDALHLQGRASLQPQSLENPVRRSRTRITSLSPSIRLSTPRPSTPCRRRSNPETRNSCRRASSPAPFF